MIKRTPQEIADFFGCYVAMDKNGEWYYFEDKPKIDNIDSQWHDCNYSGDCIHIRIESINPPVGHDWTTLYEPTLKKKTKKLVPFDLSKKEDRDALRGKWITSEDFAEEYLIHNFSRTFAGINPIKYVWSTSCGNGEALFKYYTFLDGSPVGKEVEE